MEKPTFRTGRGPILITLVAIGLLAGCASPAPVVYRDSAQNGAVSQLDRDVQSCSRLAETAIGRNDRSARGVATSAAKGGLVGLAAAGAASFVAQFSNAGLRTLGGGAGAATGIVAKQLLEWNEPDSAYRGWVERCLKKRGHQVVGWR